MKNDRWRYIAGDQKLINKHLERTGLEDILHPNLKNIETELEDVERMLANPFNSATMRKEAKELAQELRAVRRMAIRYYNLTDEEISIMNKFGFLID